MPDSEFPTDWRTCAADLFEQYHAEVLARLARRNSTVDPADLNDAFVTALLEIAAEPDKFDANRESQWVDFLVGAAQRALLGLLRTHRRRQAREEKKGELVAQDQSAARPFLEELADVELAEAARTVAETEEERKVLQLWELGVTDLAEYGNLLGLEHLSEAQLKQEVKTIRDRLTARLRRLRPKFDDL